MQRHLELGDDPKVASSSANGPEKVRVLVRAGLDLTPISQHQGRAENVVAAEAVLAHEGTDAASEKKTSYADGRTLTQRGGDPCLGCLYLNRAAQHAASNARGHFFHANGYPAEAGHVEHNASLAGEVAGIAVAPAADSEGQTIGPDEAQSGLEVLHIGRMHDERRMRVIFGRVAFAKPLIVRISGSKGCSSQSPHKGCEVSIARL